MSNFKDNLACISSSGRQVTYRELRRLTRGVCAWMKPHGLVFCLCSNTLGAIVGYVACLRNSNAVLLLDAGMSRESFDDLVRVYLPEYIWAPESSSLMAGGHKLLDAEGYALFRTGYHTPVADDLAVLLATSGSTGSPKVVRLSKKNLLSNARSIISYLHITDKERPVLGLPINYAFGLSIVNSHLLSGATLLLTERSFIEREFVDFAVGNGFTSYSGVPFAFETIRKLAIWKRPMPSLCTLTMAGGMPSSDLVRFFDDTLRPLGKKLYVMYGQAEATARISYLEPEMIPAKIGSIGKAIPGGELWLEDEDGEVIKSPFVIGELVYRGDNVCLGYAEKAEDLMRGDDNGGVLHTGDLGYRDADGFYFISGRKARFVKLYGLRIGLDHIEALLQPLVGDCACVGDDSHISVYTTDRGVDGNEVIEMLSRRTKVPRKSFSIIFVDRIPRAKSGKVLYANLVNR